jgi:hypothetical protein
MTAIWGRNRGAVLVGVTLLAVFSGCGGGEEATSSDRPPAASAAPPAKQKRATPDSVTPSHCPAGLPSCRSTEGRVVYVDRVDPDGDGDTHFVVADSRGITLPGLTAIDVRKGLRPRPLPGPGDLISAAGPVQTGSYGQRQIHAIELHVAEP